MPAANRIKIANDGLIFREDFLNPQTCAANGALVRSGGVIAAGYGHIQSKVSQGPIYWTDKRLQTQFTIIVDFDLLSTPDTGPNWNVLVHVGENVGSRGFLLGVYDQKLTAIAWGTAPTNLGTLDVGKRYTLAWSYGNSTSFVCKDGGDAMSSTWSSAHARSGAMAIGGTTSPQLNGIQSRIFGIQIYNRALSAEEIRAHYRTTRGNMQ